MNIVTRFAPSPTGFLHIGGARTALFNFLFARHHGGRYLLRVEDTDKERSTTEAIAAIHEGLKWLGLEGDDEPIYQSRRAERHTEIAENLLAKGHAYRCYLTPDELQSLRETARESGKKIINPWRDSDAQPAPDHPFTVRLKMPTDGSTTINDAVQGKVTVQHDQLDDLVMLRSDGTPTYMLAVVVDDHDMQVSHVIRGDDHLNNAFRQMKIIEAMDWPLPTYAHIPLIHGSDGAKLSKRHGALSVMAYAEMGYLPEAMNNYLLRLGWGHGDDEIINRKQAIEWFDLKGVGQAAARFDGEKLASLNNTYLRAMPNDALAALIMDSANVSSPVAASRVENIGALFAERAQTINELVESMGFILDDGVPSVADDARRLLDPLACARLLKMADALPFGDDFRPWLNNWLEAEGLKMRDIGPALRAAVTGRKQTPDIMEICTALGSDAIGERIQKNCQSK